MTTEQRLENLERELARTKRRNRWLLAAVGLALGVWILAGTFGPTTAAAPTGGGAVKEVRANRFVLVDENGKTRADLFMDIDGPRLYLCDENGKIRAVLAASKDEPKLILCDENDETRAMLAAPKIGPGLILRDENGKIRAMLGAPKIGPGLSLFDENQRPIWRAPGTK